MGDEQTVNITRTPGGPLGAGMLADALRKAGATVTYEPPLEERGVAQDAHEVAAALVATGMAKATKETCRAFLKRHRQARIQVDGEEQQPDVEG